MHRWQTSVLPVIFASLASCVVESSPPTPRTPVGADAPGTTAKKGVVRGECQTAADRGCFDGFLKSEREILVDGRRFFNAEDLAARFGEILSQNGSSSPTRDGPSSKVSSLTWITPLAGDGFLVGFEYDLAGPVHRSGRVRMDGRIKLEDLPPDTYDLRVGRPLVLRTKSPGSPATDDSGSLVMCGTLYADLALDIREGERTWAAIEEFQWHHQSEGCTETTTDS